MGFTFNGLSGAAVTISGALQTEPAAISGTGKTAKTATHFKQATGIDTAVTAYTVTAAKILYITNLTISGTAGTWIRVGDNLASGATYTDGTKYDNGVLIVIAASAPVSINFDVPLPIDTALTYLTSASGNVTLTWTGWEA